MSGSDAVAEASGALAAAATRLALAGGIATLVAFLKSLLSSIGSGEPTTEPAGKEPRT